MFVERTEVAFYEGRGRPFVHSVTQFQPYALRMHRLPLLALRVALTTFVLLLSGCATRSGPDLAVVYASAASATSPPPVIVIPGLMGTRLLDERTGEELWPGPLSRIAFGDYARLARIGPSWESGDGVVAGPMIREIGRYDIYGALLGTLEGAGRFAPGKPGQAPSADDRRRYYTLAYDWRQPNIVAVRQLHALIDQLRRDFDQPDLRVDIIAHSNGGLIANYYLRYGPEDVLEQADPQPWAEGAKRVRRVAMLGTPNLGSVTSLRRLLEGFRFSLRTMPVEALASFPTVFETLPHPATSVIFDREGKPVTIDLHDPHIWRDNGWSVYSPEVKARVQASASPGSDAGLTQSIIEGNFERHLRRGKQFQLALSRPFPTQGLRMAAFGGDCEPTPAGAVLQVHQGRAMLAFRPGDVSQPVPGVDYEALMSAPGDGLVTRASQDAAAEGFVPLRQSFFLCENHGQLLANRAFQNNLLNFLLGP